jgi:hypothetical protein
MKEAHNNFVDCIITITATQKRDVKPAIIGRSVLGRRRNLICDTANIIIFML